MNKKFSWSFAIIGLALFISFFIFNSVYIAAKPTVETVAVHTEENKATLNGLIKDGEKISEYGFRWGTSKNLSESKKVGTNIEAEEDFNVIISGLKDGTSYYYQAYAVNKRGTAFGEIKNFQTLVKPNVAPIVSISTPEDHANITRGELVHIAATAQDEQKVETMSLYLNDQLKTRTKDGSLTWDWQTNDVDPGDYTIKVTAWDGKKEAEKKITMEVKAEPTQGSVPGGSTLAASGSQSVIKETPKPAPKVSRGSGPSDARYSKLSKSKGSYGSFWYRDTSGGRIEIDPQWIEDNIVTITLPGLNQRVQVNKAAADNFMQAFNYIKNGTAIINGKKVSLLSLIKTMDGTFVTRHVMWNPSRGLSNHSWGTAIDINADNHFRAVDPSREPNDPNLILWERAFKPAGFSWGNRYSDSMHFELLD